MLSPTRQPTLDQSLAELKKLRQSLQNDWQSTRGTKTELLLGVRPSPIEQPLNPSPTVPVILPINTQVELKPEPVIEAEPDAVLTVESAPVPVPSTPAPASTAPTEWAAYLCRLKSLPSVTITVQEAIPVRLYWDNLYDYYAEQFHINSTVDTLAQLQYCSARAILIEFAQLLDGAIKSQSSFWNFKRDPEELALLKVLRRAL